MIQEKPDTQPIERATTGWTLNEIAEQYYQNEYEYHEYNPEPAQWRGI